MECLYLYSRWCKYLPWHVSTKRIFAAHWFDTPYMTQHNIIKSGFIYVHETATYRCDDTRGCVMQFWPPDDEHICSKHVEAWNKLIVKQTFCASSWLITEINILRCTVSKTSKFAPTCFGLWPLTGSIHNSLAKVIFRLKFSKNYVAIWQLPHHRITYTNVVSTES